MKLTSYKEALTRDKKDADAAAAEYRAKETKARLNLESVQLEAEIAAAEANVQRLSSAYPLDADSLIDSLDDLALLTRKSEQLGEVIKQLFPA
jgi:hypothetical protein